MSRPPSVSRRALLHAAGALALLPAAGWAAAEYDLVIAGGRVLDPATGTDRVADVGIRGGRVITTRGRGLRGRRVLEARDCVVSPGFVDILSAPHPEGGRYKLLDGVTTVISTHGGPIDIPAWQRQVDSSGAHWTHYGTVVGHGALRAAAGADDRNRPATPAQVARMARLAEEALRGGALGVGFGIEYVPGTSGQEVTALAESAARFRGSVHAHIRLPDLLDPFQGINELIAAAALTGARVQVVHLASMAIRRMREALALLDAARARGLDIAADVYPYDAWMAPLQSAIFDPGWQEKYLLDYGDLVWVKTGERLTAETFAARRAEGGHVACHQIPEEEIELALRHPAVSVASDGYIGEAAVSHPRGAGTFCRVLGRYVRERQVLSLPEALRKMTVQPVQRLEPAAPALRRKGRLAPGMDADLTVFHPDRVADRATFAEPRQSSVGVRHVVVAGTPMVVDGTLQEAAPRSGRWVRAAG